MSDEVKAMGKREIRQALRELFAEIIMATDMSFLDEGQDLYEVDEAVLGDLFEQEQRRAANKIDTKHVRF